MAYQSFGFPKPQERSSFRTAEELKKQLEDELTHMGWAGQRDLIEVNQARVYGAQGFQDVPGEFDVRVRHQATGGQAWFGRVRGAPNETLLIKAGEGWNMMRGDLLTVGPAGILEQQNVTPFHTGIQSFARRVAASFGEYAKVQSEQQNAGFGMRETIMDMFRRVNTIETPWGVSYQDPLGQDIKGLIPASNIYLSSIESPSRIRQAAFAYNVPFMQPAPGASGETFEQRRDRYAQELTNMTTRLATQAKEWGLTPNSPWARLFGGYVHEPNIAQQAVFETPLGTGSLAVRGGETTYDMMTQKPHKQTVVADVRETAIPGYLSTRKSGERVLERIPQKYLRRASLTLRSGETPITGIPVQVATSMQALPWSSGAMQFNLPERLQKLVTGEDGQLAAIRPAGHIEEVQAKSLSEFAESKFQMNQDLIGRVLDQNRQVFWTTGLEEGHNLSYSAGNQIEKVLGYRAILPEAWQRGMSEESLAPWMERLRAKGFTEIEWGARENPILEMIRDVATPAGIKGGGAKGQENVGLAGVDRLLTTAMGRLPYDVLQEGKNIDAVVLNMLQGMEKPQKFLGTLFRGDTRMLSAINSMTRFKIPFNLEELGLLSGKEGLETGEATLMAITNALRAYPNQDELLKRFGVGFVQAGAPIEQYTPETLKIGKEAIYEHLRSQGMQTDIIKKYLRAFNQNIRFDDKTGLYTSYSTQEMLYGPGLKRLVQESAGLGSTQGEMLQGMIAQGHTNVAQYLRDNENLLFPDSPARGALRNVARAWMSTKAGNITDPLRFRTIDADMAQKILTAVNVRADAEGGGQLDIMRYYEEEMRQATGAMEGAEPIYWFNKQKTAMAGGGAFRELESLLAVLNEEGGLDFETQSQVATRFNKFMRALLESTTQDWEDPLAREAAFTFQGKYVDSDQLRKQSGGIFSRYGGSTLLKPGQIMMTEEGLRRYYIQQGGSIGNKREWNRYLRTMEGATGVAIRYPAPNIGSAGMPGSVQPVQIMTPGKYGNPIANLISTLYKSQGLMLPELIASSMYGANLGDIDLDPMTLLPLTVRTGKRGREWERFQGPVAGDNAEYSKWLRHITDIQSPAQQQRTFNAIFGSLAASQNPFGKQMQASIERMMGPAGQRLLQERLGRTAESFTESLFDKRAVVAGSEFQRAGEDWNLVKTREMGLTYNTYRRRPEAAAAFLGIPEKLSTEMVDISQRPYQMAIDFEKMQTSWANLMNTSGFTMNKDKEVSWGRNISQDKFVWQSSGLGLNKDFSNIVTEVGGALGLSEMPSDWVAGMVMQVPERGTMTDAEFEENLRGRRSVISERIQNIRSSGAQNAQAFITELTDMSRTGLVGINSIIGVSSLARAFEYTGKDAEKRAQIAAAINKQGGLLIGGERVPYEVAEKRYRPLSTLFDFRKHSKGETSYKDVVAIGETLLAAQQGGWANTPIIRDYRKVWGALAGYSEKGPLTIAHPVTGKPLNIQTQEDLDVLRQAGEQLDFARVGTKLDINDYLEQIKKSKKGTALRASELGYPGGYRGPAKAGEQGTEVHKYLEAYAKSERGKARGMYGAEEELAPEGIAMTGHPDYILRGQGDQPDTIFDLKTGSGGTENFVYQLAGYNYLKGGGFAGAIMQMPKETVLNVIKKQEEARGQKEGLSEQQVNENIGERIVQDAEAKAKRYTSEQIGPDVLKRGIENWASAGGVPLTPRTPGTVGTGTPLPVAGAIPTQQATAPPPETPSGGGTGSGGTGSGGRRRTPPGETPQGEMLIRMGKLDKTGKALPPTSYIRGDDLAAVLGMAGVGGQGGAPFDEEAEGVIERMSAGGFIRSMDDAQFVRMAAQLMKDMGIRGNTLVFGGRNKPTPITAQFIGRSNVAAFKSYFGTITDQNELVDPGSLTKGYKELPQLLSQIFKEGSIERQSIGALTPEEALLQAPKLAEEQGINFRRAVEKIPEIKSLLQQFRTFVKAGKALTPVYDTALTGEASDTALNATRAIVGGGPVGETLIGQLGSAGAQVNTAYAGFAELERRVSGEKVGRAGEQPVGDIRAQIARDWISTFTDMTKQIDEQTKVISTYKGKQLEFNEVLRKGHELTGKHLETFEKYQVALGKAEKLRDVASYELMTKAGRTPVKGAISEDVLREIYAGTPSDEVVKALDKYGAAQETLATRRAQVATAAMHPGKPIPGEGGLGMDDVGRLSRRMLGGFGLMYMRSIFDIATQGSQLGYAESLEQQQMIQAATGGQYGGMIQQLTPEEEYKRAAAPYGGLGWRALQTARARAVQEPGMAGAMGMATAGIGAFGAMSWASMMAPALAPAILPVTLATMGGVAAMNVYGAATDSYGNAVNLASQIARGNLTLENGDVRGNVLSGLFNWSKYGYAINREEQQPMVERLEAMRQYQRQGGKDLRGFLREQGVAEGNINFWISQYGQVQAAQYPEVPVEGLIQANLLQQRYGIGLTEGTGGTRALFGAGLAQGIPYQQTAMAAAATPWRNWQEQQTAAGRIMQSWLQRGGLSIEQAEKLATGQGRYEALGFLAPQLGMLHGTPEYQYMEQGPGGVEFPVIIPGTPDIDLTEKYKERLGEMSQASAQLMARVAGVQQRRALTGLPYQTPRIEDYETMNEQEAIRRQREIQADELRQSAIDQAYSGFLGLGMAPGNINMQQFEGMNIPQLSILSQQQQQAQGLLGTLSSRGMPQQQAMVFAQSLAQASPKAFEQVMNVLSGNPLQFAATMTQNPALMAQMPLNVPGMGGVQIPTPYLGMTDIREFTNRQGQYQQEITGMSWGTSSLAMPGITSAQMGARIFGNIGQYGSAGQAAINALISGGQFGFQQLQLAEQAKYQGAMASTQMQQIALQRQYYADMWPIEDKMRNLGYRQQEWGFQQQREQLAMSDRFFQQNLGINMQQSQMQRGWSRQDWAFQDMQRAQQWGWRQEDFQENVRFMTGRDRRLAERQMARETIMYGQEGEQIDKQRQRQEELWKLEDERFRIQRSQHEEQKRFQEEAIKKQEQFFNERRKLEEQQVKISRQYQLDQLALQEKMAGASAAFNEKQLEYQKIMMLLSQETQKMTAKGNLFNQDTIVNLAEAMMAGAEAMGTLTPELKKFFEELIDAAKKMGVDIGGKGGGGGGGGGRTDDVPRQHGGITLAGERSIVGEAGPELRRPFFTEEIIPMHKFDPWQHGIPLTLAGNDGGGGRAGMVHLVLNLGGQYLKDFVLDLVDKEIDA